MISLDVFSRQWKCSRKMNEDLVKDCGVECRSIKESEKTNVPENPWYTCEISMVFISQRRQFMGR